MIRRLLEHLGLADPRPEEESVVRSDAMAANEEARREIHDSRERRAILQLRLEHIQRHK